MTLEMKNLTKNYGNYCALNSFSITLTDGIYGLLGANGAGKSTLMSLITDNVQRTSGEILCDGKEILKLGKKFRQKIGFMPQQQGYYENMSARAFILYMASLKGINKKEAKMQTDKLLKTVNLEKVSHKKIGEFSGGMKQRVLLAQAMLGNPEILLLDEPTAGLDPMGRDVLLSQIVDYHRQRNNTVLLVSHSMEDIARIADRVLVIDDGKVAMFEKTDKVFAQSARLSQMGLRVPQITKIMTMLREKGYPVSSGVLTVEQGVQEILRILGREEESRGQ